MEQGNNATRRKDESGSIWDEAEVIASYTRRQALEDGVLVDVSQTAQECGFKHPVAVTARVWAEVIEPDEQARAEGQSETGRLWDVLWMLRNAVQRAVVEKGDALRDEVRYGVLIGAGAKRSEKRLRAVCRPGDEGEPVITIMMPNED